MIRSGIATEDDDMKKDAAAMSAPSAGYAGYRCILIDPPWQHEMTGRYKKARHKRATELPYHTMSLEQMLRLTASQVGRLRQISTYLNNKGFTGYTADIDAVLQRQGGGE